MAEVVENTENTENETPAVPQMSTVERAEMLLKQDATIREKIKSGATLDEAVDPSNKEFGPLGHPEQVQMRVAKRAMMLESGIAPYPVHLDVTNTIEEVRAKYHGKLVEHLWEHFYEDKLYEPTFVRDFPVETSPLVKGHRTKPGVVEKWDLYVRGFELATGYSELNDPIVQRERFVAQAKDALAGDEEACDIDEDFLEALGVGMPPAGGMGMGIDRLLIALTGATIRETITFPLVKPLVG